MLTRVHVHSKVEKLLTQMKKQGNLSLIVAKRAETIIKNLVKGFRPMMAGFFSKDARIKSLYKFNLGSGYRLVCIREKYNIFILFIGSHDNCETWINKRKGLPPHKAGLFINTYDVNVPDRSLSKELTHRDEIEDDSFLIPEITDKDLRKVFRGLINNG